MSHTNTDKELFVHGFIVSLQHALLRTYVRSGISLEELGIRLGCEPEKLRATLMDPERISLRDAATIYFALTGETLEMEFVPREPAPVAPARKTGAALSGFANDRISDLFSDPDTGETLDGDTPVRDWPNTSTVTLDALRADILEIVQDTLVFAGELGDG